MLIIKLITNPLILKHTFLLIFSTYEISFYDIYKALKISIKMYVLIFTVFVYHKIYNVIYTYV